MTFIRFENRGQPQVSPTKWRVAVGLLLVTLIAGGGLIILLALGIADPPRAGSLVWEAQSLTDWQIIEADGDYVLRQGPCSLPAAPYTLELEGSNTAGLDSAWGVWLQLPDENLYVLVSRDGYLSMSPTRNPDWQHFIHVRDVDNNLYLHVDRYGSATLRVNDEIAWAGEIPTVASAWGVVSYRAPRLAAMNISIYANLALDETLCEFSPE